VKIKKDNTNLENSEIIEQMPLVCSDELAAVEFLEERLWKGKPHCTHCQSTNVYKMVDSKTGQRNKRFLWRCHDCHGQFTVRINTVFEETRIPLRHWCYAFWRASTSKKGVSALEIKRQCQLSYKSALFLMHRVRFAMTPVSNNGRKLRGTVECDELYCGGKPRPGSGQHNKRGRGTKKTPVFAMVERNGDIYRRVVPNVTGKTLKSAIRECVSKNARIITDEFKSYRGIGREFKGGHAVVHHGVGQYVINDAYTNTAESSFALLKRGLVGIYHAVSKEHLHRYVGEFDWRWNTRKLNDGDRTALAIQNAQGKRLVYSDRQIHA
jgi:transposase-like protein